MIPVFDAPQQDWTGWLTESAAVIRSRVLTEGVVVVRGLPLKNPADVALARDALGIRVFQSTERFGHRQEGENGVVSPIRWPEERDLCPYQEESFSLVAPSIVLTGCIRPPDVGGEALLSDSRQISRHLPPDFVNQVRTHGWIMTRVFHQHFGMSWQDAFGCLEREELVSLLDRKGIAYEWLDDGTLRTRRRRPVFRTHPVTGDDCWFNQLAFLNRGSLEPRERELLFLAFGDDLPMDTALGDGQSLSDANFQAILDAYDATTTKLAWQAGDLFVADNLLTAQGRASLVGDAEYWIAFGDPISEYSSEKESVGV